jgi:hypothetical protein
VFGFSQEIFSHTHDYRDVFRAMVGTRSGAAVQRLLHKVLVDLVREDVKQTVARTGHDAVPAEAVVQFMAGALFGLMMWWLDGKPRVSVSEVNALFRRLAVAALKAARG